MPGGGAIARLPGLAGRARTLEIILGSITLSGALADHYGVVNRSVPDAELDAFVSKGAPCGELDSGHAEARSGVP